MGERLAGQNGGSLGIRGPSVGRLKTWVRCCHKKEGLRSHSHELPNNIDCAVLNSDSCLYRMPCDSEHEHAHMLNLPNHSDLIVFVVTVPDT